jgi:hypothetical protein
MATNMSYCRFQNTLLALQECADAMDDAELSEQEALARACLLKLCRQLADDYADDED